MEDFAFEDCPEVFGDEIERTVVWSGGSDVSQLAGNQAGKSLFPDEDNWSIVMLLEQIVKTEIKADSNEA